MRSSRILVYSCVFSALIACTAQAGCFPVDSDVVSLGEKAARFYGERSLTNAIDEKKRSVEASGNAVGKVVKGELACKPFPNLIGADEWRCIGNGKVCTKS